MLGRLEELVREIAVDVLEVVAHGHEMTMCESREQKPELRLVRLEPVDLLMLKKVGPDNRDRLKEFSSCSTESRVCREGSIGFEPRTRCALRYVEMRPAAQHALGFRNRVAEIVCGDRFEDVLQGVNLVSTWSPGESVEAFGALVELKDLEAVASFAFLDGVAGLAFGTRGSLQFGLRI